MRYSRPPAKNNQPGWLTVPRILSIIDGLHAPVAQLDRVPGYEPGGRRFESFRARQIERPRLARGFFIWRARKGSNLRPSQGGSTRAKRARCEATAGGGKRAQRSQSILPGAPNRKAPPCAGLFYLARPEGFEPPSITRRFDPSEASSMRSNRRRRQARAALAVNPSGRAEFTVGPAAAPPGTASAAFCSVANPQRSFGCARGSLGRKTPQLSHLAKPREGSTVNSAGWGSNLRPSQGSSTRAKRARCEATAGGGKRAHRAQSILPGAPGWSRDSSLSARLCK